MSTRFWCAATAEPAASRQSSSSACELQLEHATVSRRHAELRQVEDGVEVTDLGSRNGTAVDCRPIRRQVVTSGCLLRFGEVDLRLETVDPADRETSISVR